MKTSPPHYINDVQEQIFSIEDRIFALEGAFTALLVALKDAGTLPLEPFRGHMANAATELEEKGLPESAAALDLLRRHLIDCVLSEDADGCKCKK